MSNKNLNEIWQSCYFEVGTKNSGEIYSYKSDDLIAEYEIKNGTLEVLVYKSSYKQKDFDDIVIKQALEQRTEDISLNEDAKIIIHFAK